MELKLTFRANELNNLIILEDINFFNSRNSINSYSFQGTLQSFVICGGSFVHGLLLSANRNVKLRKKKLYNKIELKYAYHQQISNPDSSQLIANLKWQYNFHSNTSYTMESYAISVIAFYI